MCLIVDKIGWSLQGSRILQWPNKTGLILYFIMLIISGIGRIWNMDFPVARFVFLCIYAVLFLWSFIMFALYGEGNFDDLPPVTGKFGVGIKRFFSDKNKQLVLVFYPVEKQKWLEKLKDEANWFNYNIWGDQKASYAMAKMIQHLMKSPEVGEENRSTDGMKFPAIENAEYDVTDVITSPLKPILFTHGYYANCNAYMGLQRELASHGHIVIAPEMIDGSCCYTALEDGREVPLNMEANLDNDGARVTLFNKRVQLVSEFIDELEAPDFLQKKVGLPEGVSLDMQSLVMNGHSFGAINSIGSSLAESSRIKACLSIDPWLGPLRDKAFD